MNIHIITDSASDIVGNTRPDLTVLPMTITFGQTAYRDGVDLTHKEFYEKLVEGDVLPVTSQITPFAFEEAIDARREKGEAVIVITMSGKLSGTNQSARSAAQGKENVWVVDSENVTVGERILVELALRRKDGGASPEKIVEELEQVKGRVRLVALLDTLEYLKKGGRVSAAVAFAGGLLQIKPVIAIKDGEVAVVGKARGSKQADNLIAEAVESAGGVDFRMPYFLGYTGLSDALVKKYAEDNAALWREETAELPIGTVGGTIGTHAGPGAIAVAWVAPEK